MFAPGDLSSEPRNSDSLLWTTKVSHQLSIVFKTINGDRDQYDASIANFLFYNWCSMNLFIISIWGNLILRWPLLTPVLWVTLCTTRPTCTQLCSTPPTCTQSCNAVMCWIRFLLIHYIFIKAFSFNEVLNHLRQERSMCCGSCYSAHPRELYKHAFKAFKKHFIKPFSCITGCLKEESVGYQWIPLPKCH